MIRGKNNYKQILLETKLDFTIYLNQLILLTFKNLDRFKKYSVELETLINTYTNENGQVMPISSDMFFSLSDRIDTPMKMLLNVLADESELAVSYYKFKKIIDKRGYRNEDTFGLLGLKEYEELRAVLHELNSLRNWYCHIPESSFISQLYVDSISIEGKDVTKDYSRNEINIFIFEKHDSEWLIYKREIVKQFLSSFEFIFKNMKQDYSKLVGESMSIRRVYNDSKASRPFSGGEMGELSYAINKGKLKGIDLNSNDR